MFGSLQENIEFAQKAYEYGAQGIISIYPERWYGDDDVVKFFHDLAELSKIGVWAHAVPMAMVSEGLMLSNHSVLNCRKDY